MRLVDVGLERVTDGEEEVTTGLAMALDRSLGEPPLAQPTRAPRNVEHLDRDSRGIVLEPGSFTPRAQNHDLVATASKRSPEQVEISLETSELRIPNVDRNGDLHAW